MGYSIAQVSSGLGNVVAVDVINGQEFQRIKIDLGNEGQSIPVTGSIPVTIQNPTVTIAPLGPLVGTQSVSGSVSVNNFPSSQLVTINQVLPVSGTVSVNPHAVTQGTNPWITAENVLSSLTNTIVPAATGATVILASNTSRRSFSFYNGANSTAFLLFGASPSTTRYSLQVLSGAFYEMPLPVYTGAINAVWNTALGSGFVTEGV